MVPIAGLVGSGPRAARPIPNRVPTCAGPAVTLPPISSLDLVLDLTVARCFLLRVAALL